ncbi:MAG: class I SAM-dependent methyltransferase [Candidatus Auribacterota bacterium]
MSEKRLLKRYVMTLYAGMLFIACAAQSFGIDLCHIPPEHGIVDKSTKQSGTERVVYYIQDAHCQPSAQYNIARILDAILAHHPSAIVALEGAAGTISANAFREFPDTSALKEVSRYFVDNGFLSGSEYLLITREQPFSLIGAELPEPYRQNHRTMCEALKNGSAASRFVQSMFDSLAPVIERTFSGEQREFLENWKKYRTNEIRLDDYAAYLAERLRKEGHDSAGSGTLFVFESILRKEHNINYAQLEQNRVQVLDAIASVAETAAVSDLFKFDLKHKLRKVNDLEYFTTLCEYAGKYDIPREMCASLSAYKEFLTESQSIDRSQLYREIEQAEKSLSADMFANTDQGILRDLYQYSLIYSDLVNLRVDCAGYSLLDGVHGTGWIRNACERFIPECASSIDWSELEKMVSVAHSFYEQARERDRVMFSVLSREMETRGVPVGVIIAGGFHYDGLLEMALESRTGFCAITPVMNRISNETRYLSMIQNMRTPFERWVAGSTLALASWLSQETLGDEGAAQVRTKIFSSFLIGTAVRQLSPPDLRVMTGELDGIVVSANEILGAWNTKHAPDLSLREVYRVDNHLAVEMAFGERDILFVFSSPGRKIPWNSIDFYKADVLEHATIGDSSLAVVSGGVIEHIRSLARRDGASDLVFSPEQRAELYRKIGIPDEVIAKGVTVNAVMDTYSTRRNTSGPKIMDIYDALIAVTTDTADALSVQDLSLSAGAESVHPGELTYSGILRLSMEMLRYAEQHDRIVDIENLDNPWAEVFRARNIQNVMIEQGFSFEALVVSIYNLVFTQERASSLILGGDGIHYNYLHSSKLGDGSEFIRLVVRPQQYIRTPDITLSDTLENQKTLFSSLQDSVLAVDLDGSFVLASLGVYDAQTGELHTSPARGSIMSLSPRLHRTEQMEGFIKSMRNHALEKGILVRGIVFRNQGGPEQFFNDIESFTAFFEEHASDGFLPHNSGNWTSRVGEINSEDFFNLFGTQHILVADLIGGYETFYRIEDLMPLLNKDVLEVGSQIGYNVFYAHLKGARFAAGMDINPYQQQAAREIAAYLYENEDVEITSLGGKPTRSTLSQSALSPNGVTQGQLFFRTEALKELEEREGRRIAQLPPKSIDFPIADARSIPYEDNSFDVVTSSYMLGFISLPSTALKEMLRVVRPGGIVRYIYGTTAEGKSLLEEAVYLLQEEKNIRVDYEILFSDYSAMFVRIKAKHHVADIAQDTARILQHSAIKSQFPNNFDSYPYIQPIFPSPAMYTDESGLRESVQFSMAHSLKRVSRERLFNLLSALEFFRGIYGSTIFNGINRITIDGSLDAPGEIRDGELFLHPQVLDHRLLTIFALQIAVNTLDVQSIPDEFFLQYGIALQDINLYRRTIPLLQAILLFKDSFTAAQQLNLIRYLRSSPPVDTGFFRHIREMSGLLENIYRAVPEEQELLRLTAQYAAGMTGTEPELITERSEAVFDSAEYLSPAGSSSRLYMRYLNHRITNMLAGSDTPDAALAAWREVIPYYERLLNSTVKLPETIEELVSDDMTASLLSKYPVTAGYVITEMLKACFDDPADQTVAPYLLELPFPQIQEIIERLHAYTAKTRMADHGVRTAIPTIRLLEPSNWIGPRLHDELVDINNGEEYKTLTIDLQGTDTEALTTSFLSQFNGAVDALGINDNELVVVKTNIVKSWKHEYEGYDYIEDFGMGIIAARPEEIRRHAEEIVTLRAFLVFELSYAKNFSAANNSIHSSYFSVSPQLQSVSGLGSEFFKREASLFPMLWLGAAMVEAITNQLRVMPVFKREYFAELRILKGLSEMKTVTPGLHAGLASLMFRLNIITEQEYSELWNNKTDAELLYKRVSEGFSRYNMRGFKEIDTMMSVSAELTQKKHKLSWLTNIYTTLRNDPNALLLLPGLLSDFSDIEDLLSMESNNDYLREPVSLLLEKKVFGEMDELEQSIRQSFVEDTTGTLEQYRYLLAESTDTTAAFDTVSSYVDANLPMMPLVGTVPIYVTAQNRGNALNIIFESARDIAQRQGVNKAVSVLTSNDVMLAVAQSVEKGKKAEFARRAVHVLASAALTESRPGYTMKALRELALRLSAVDKSAVNTIFHDQRWIPLLTASPQAAFRLMSYLAFQVVINPDNTYSLFKRVISLPEEKFSVLLEFVNTVDTDYLDMQLPAVVSLIELGLPGLINHLNANTAKYGSFVLLTDYNGIISRKSKGYPITIESHALSRAAFDSLYAGYGSKETALWIRNWLAEKNIPVEIVSGSIPGAQRRDFFIKTNGIVIGLSPFVRMFNPSYTDEEVYEDPALPQLSAFASVELGAGTPLMWRPVDAVSGMLFEGDIRDSSLDPEYMVFSIRSSMIARGTVLKQYSYDVHVSRAVLPELVSALAASRPENFFLITAQMRDVYVVSKDIDDEFMKSPLQSESFNHLFYRLFTHLDTEWLKQEQEDTLLGQTKLFSREPFIDEIGLVPVSMASSRDMAFLQQVMPDVAMGFTYERIDVALADQSDLEERVIFLRGVPVGMVTQGQKALMMEELNDDLKSKIEELLIDKYRNFSPFRKGSEQVSQLTTIAVFRLDSAGYWVADAESVPEGEADALDTYIRAIQSAQRSLNIKPAGLRGESISMRLVQGHWRLGDRQLVSADGKTELVIDIDAFRDPDLLEFVIRHEFDPHDGPGGEILALMHDIASFSQYDSGKQGRILSALRSEHVDLDGFADILEQSGTLSRVETVKAVTDFVMDKNHYPRLQAVLSGKSSDEVMNESAVSLDPELSADLLKMGYSYPAIAAVLTHPNVAGLKRALSVWADLSGSYQERFAGMGPQILVNALLGDKKGLPEIAETLFELNSIVFLKGYQSALSVYGVSGVIQLLSSINGDPARRSFVQQSLRGMQSELGNQVYFETRTDENMAVSMFVAGYQQGGENHFLHYTPDGMLERHAVIPVGDFNQLLPELVRQFNTTMENQFAGRLDIVLAGYEELLTRDSITSEDKKNFLASIAPLIKDMASEYRGIVMPDISSVPLYRRYEMLNILDQFKSDVIGSPIAGASAYLELLNEGLGDVDAIFNEFTEVVRKIRETSVRFRMIQDYVIQGREPMIVFDKTYRLASNKPFTDIPLVSDRAIRSAVEQRMLRSGADDTYIIYLDGTDPAALVWVSALLEKHADTRPVIAIVSDTLDTDTLDQLLAVSGIPAEAVMPVGADIIRASGIKDTYGGMNHQGIIDIVSANMSVGKGETIFLTSSADTFAQLTREGRPVLALPGIQAVIKPAPVRVINSAVYENSV